MWFRCIAPWVCFCALLCAALSGCGVGTHSPPPSDGGTSPPSANATLTEEKRLSSGAFDVFSGEYTASDVLREDPPTLVAVGPFGGDPANWDFAMEDETPPHIVRRAFYNHLSSLPFQDIELAETDRRLAGLGVDGYPELTKLLEEDPQALAAGLRADAVVVGTVSHFDRVFVGLASQVAVGCEVMLFDLRPGAEGEVLWRAEHVSRGLAGGVSITPWGMALNALSSLWNLRSVQMLRETDDLFREMVSTIEAELPVGRATAAPIRPTVDLFVCLAPDRPLRAGERLRFRLVGDPRCRAAAMLEPLGRTVPLHPLPAAVKEDVARETLSLAQARAREANQPLTPAEVEDIRTRLATREIYEGGYPVPPGEEAYGVLARAVLENRAGGAAETVFAPRRIDLDGKGPEPPRELTAAPRDRTLHLRWTAGEDAVRHTVAVRKADEGEGPAAAPAAIIPTHSADGMVEAVVRGLDNFTQYVATVTAFDAADNPSVASAHAEAMPLPSPGLLSQSTTAQSMGRVLSGTLRSELLLLAADGPFVVEDTLTVAEGGVLHVGPGTEMRFRPRGALRVSGGDLRVYGEADAPATFAPEGDHFAGVVLEDSPSSAISFLRILSPVSGLVIRNSAPVVHGLEIRDASQAGLLLQQGARPHITCTRVIGSGGMGGIVAEGRGTRPTVRRSSFVDNDPFQVQSFTPSTLDLSGNYWGAEGPGERAFLGMVRIAPWLEVPPDDCAEPLPQPPDHPTDTGASP